MKAVIVAAGTGSRMGAAGATPKCLLEVGGQSILARALAALAAAGTESVILIVGHRQEEVAAAVRSEHRLSCELRVNPFYATTNNMASLWFARPGVEGEAFLYLHGDLVFDPGILERLLRQPEGNALAVARGAFDEEAMKVELTAEGYLARSSKSIRPPRSVGEWIGLARFAAADSRALFDAIEELLLEGQYREYDTGAFTRLAGRRVRFAIVDTGGLPYVEVDTPADLARARGLFPPAPTPIPAGRRP